MKLFAATVFFFLAGASFASSSKDEIEALLTYVSGLEGASFIRNGGAHSASAASSHLRLKWQKQEKKIRSAEEFIALCGSKSSISGDRYRIRFSDRSERFCDDVLTEKLTTLRKTTHLSSPPTPTNRSG